MSPLPALTDWEDTRNSLKQALQVLRSTRLLGSNPLPNELHYSTYATPFGASTGPLSFGGRLNLDYTKMAVIYEQDNAEVFSVALQGQNQTSLFDAVYAEFAKVGQNLDPNRDKVTETTAFKINAQHAKDYAEVQWRVFTAMAHFKGYIFGPQSPIALWPHGFDLSTLWFVDGMDEHKDPQMNFGFSPGTPDRPYFYFYAWPVPDGLVGSELPRGGKWATDWPTPGGLFDYDSFVNEANPEKAITYTLLEMWMKASAMLKGG